MNSESGYLEFWKAAHEHYPEAMQKGGLLDQGIYNLIYDVVNSKPNGRFVKPTERKWVCDYKGWMFPVRQTFRYEAAMALTYKGLINIKAPCDLALYTRLIWELQPKTIIELGSFQGGSGLWFADQASVLCQEPSEVHSFDIHTKCRGESAVHPHLHFHECDLTNTDSFDVDLLHSLSHPWLVVDDAHVKVYDIFRFLNRFLLPGDYYIVEDVPLRATLKRRRNKLMFAYQWLLNRAKKHRTTPAWEPLPTEIVAGATLFEEAGWMVDTHYVDAYAYNMTCSPNSWYRKMYDTAAHHSSTTRP